MIPPTRPLKLCQPSLSSHAPACGHHVTCLHISAEGPRPACSPVCKALGAGLHLCFGRAPCLNCDEVQIPRCPGEAFTAVSGSGFSSVLRFQKCTAVTTAALLLTLEAASISQSRRVSQEVGAPAPDTGLLFVFPKYLCRCYFI